jgi:hypothetical protein
MVSRDCRLEHGKTHEIRDSKYLDGNKNLRFPIRA